MFPRNFKALALGMALSVTLAGGVMAQQTAPNTPITNTITLNYNTGAGEDVALVDPPSVTFRVDRKVDLLLSTVTGSAETTVVPGTTNAVLAFRLENRGNGEQGFILEVDRAGDLGLAHSDVATLAPEPNQYWLAFGSTDVFADADVITAFDAETVASGNIGNIPSDEVRFVFIVANVAETKINGLQDTFTLTATATSVNSVDPVQESRSANREIENVVLADAVSVSSLADSAVALTNSELDGQDADQGRFRVTAPFLTAVKSVAVLDEKLPGSTFDCETGTGTAVVNTATPAYLPGGCIAYTITVSNGTGTGVVAAEDIDITDVLPTGVTFAALEAGEFTIVTEGATVRVTLDTLAAGDSESFTIRAFVD